MRSSVPSSFRLFCNEVNYNQSNNKHKASGEHSITQAVRSAATYLVAALILCAASTAYSQEVAEIPFFHAPEGTAALGGGFRLGQSPYFASDNEDERQIDLVPLYLYQGKYLFARGTAGGLHVVRNDAFAFNLYTRYRFQKLDPDSHVFYTGLEEREQSLDAGIEIGIKQS